MTLSRISQADRSFDAGDARAWADYMKGRTTQQDYARSLRSLARRHRAIVEEYARPRRPGPVPGTTLKVDYARVAEAARRASPGSVAHVVGIMTGCSPTAARTRIERARALGYEIPQSPFSPIRGAA